MQKKLYITPIFLALFSIAIILISLQLDTSPEMIVGDSMQARSFPIFLMAINLILISVLFLQFFKNYPKKIMYKIILLFCCSITVSYGQINPLDIEIVRDFYGVPHISGKLMQIPLMD